MNKIDKANQMQILDEKNLELDWYKFLNSGDVMKHFYTELERAQQSHNNEDKDMDQKDLYSLSFKNREVYNKLLMDGGYCAYKSAVIVNIDLRGVTDIDYQTG